MTPRLRRLSGYLLLGVFFSTFATSLSADHIEGQDDALCVVAPGGNSPTTIKSKAASSAPSHCAVCHWVRAVAGAASFGPAPALAVVIEESLDAGLSASKLVESTFSQSSPRAPPASSRS